jgi:hypothetical protein
LQIRVLFSNDISVINDIKLMMARFPRSQPPISSSMPSSLGLQDVFARLNITSHNTPSVSSDTDDGGGAVLTPSASSDSDDHGGVCLKPTTSSIATSEDEEFANARAGSPVSPLVSADNILDHFNSMYGRQEQRLEAWQLLCEHLGVEIQPSIKKSKAVSMSNSRKHLSARNDG